MMEWRGTLYVRPRGRAKSLIIPADAVSRMGLEDGDAVHVTLETVRHE